MAVVNWISMMLAAAGTATWFITMMAGAAVNNPFSTKLKRNTMFALSVIIMQAFGIFAYWAGKHL